LNCLTSAYKQNEVNYYISKYWKDQAVVFVQNIIYVAYHF